MSYVDHTPHDARTTYNLVWDSVGLEWVKYTPSGGTGGGGAVTVADGADVAQGTTTDAESAAGNGTVISLLKRIRTLLANVVNFDVLLSDMVGIDAATTTHSKSIQIGGTTTAGNEWHAAQVTAADPLANANGLAVRNLSGMGTPGVSAPSIWHVVGGRDPVTNAMRQMDLMVSAPGGTENGLVTRNIPSGTQPVSGTFWQATQPVSGTFWQATQPVSGTFWQATQPISATQLPTVLAANGGIKVEGVAGGVAQPVSGTFWQATQPVSGTFFQATQPVSIASMPSTPVTGTFWQATQPVSGTFFQATQPVSGTVTITPPTLTKGTQGSTGLSTQDLKDAGRNVLNFFMVAGVAGTNAEVMQTLTGYKSGAAVTGTATPAVITSGKTYRITQITLSYQSLATAGGCLFRLRANLSGTATSGSPLVMNWIIGSAAAVAGVTTTLDIPFPDGLEFAAGTGIAVGMLGISTVGAALASGFGTITIYGYEY